MSIRSQTEFEKLRVIGRIVRKALDATANAVRPGITTGELDEIGARVLAENGAQSAPPKVYGFPGALCISIDEEAIHGIPGPRVVQSGDHHQSVIRYWLRQVRSLKKCGHPFTL